MRDAANAGAQDCPDDSIRSLDIQLSKESANNLQLRRKSFTFRIADQMTPQSILRPRSLTSTPLAKAKKVTFKDPITTTRDYGDADTNVYGDASNSGEFTYLIDFRLL